MYAFIYIFYNLSIPILDCLLQHCAALVSQKQAEPSSYAIGGTRRRLCMLKGGEGQSGERRWQIASEPTDITPVLSTAEASIGVVAKATGSPEPAGRESSCGGFLGPFFIVLLLQPLCSITPLGHLRSPGQRLSGSHYCNSFAKIYSYTYSSGFKKMQRFKMNHGISHTFNFHVVYILKHVSLLIVYSIEQASFKE